MAFYAASAAFISASGAVFSFWAVELVITDTLKGFQVAAIPEMISLVSTCISDE